MPRNVAYAVDRTTFSRRALIPNSRPLPPAVLDLVAAFGAVARQHPDRPAVVHNAKTLTYTRLAALADATAQRIGPRPGVVGVMTSRSPGTVAGLLGVLAAGGTYCPIDPSFPPDRQQAMASAAGCRMVLVAEPGLPSPPGLPRIDLPDAADSPDTDVPLRGQPVHPEDPAYILFTSGSTSAPKPVVTPHRAIGVAVASLQRLFGLTPGDRVLQFASLNWDTCFEEILPTLTTGGALVFDDAAYSGSFARFLRMVASARITVLDLPTAYWHELVHHLAQGEVALPECLRLLVIGGEAANSARLAEWCALDSGRVRLLNTYGCTETTLITHAVDLHGPLAPSFPAPWQRTARVPIGTALPHVLDHVSDNGELLIGGPSVALGYRGLPEATAARFGGREGDGRFFRTGDRVSRAGNGLLTHLGRLDNEVKVRGIRVDPGEVEAQIAGHPEVNAVAVAGVTVAGRTALVAHIVPRPGADTGVLAASALATDVLAYLRARVPTHLIPSRINVVPALVYTASGKVDRLRSHQQALAYHQVQDAVP